jgi:hypothetical protein
MTDDAELAWRLYLEHCNQGRHHETQRAGVTQYVIAVSAGIGSLIGVGGITATDLPLAAVIVMLGFFGAVFAAKQYERFRYHMEHAARFRRHLERAVPGLDIASVRRDAKSEHKTKHPRLEAMGLNRLWVLLHLLVALVGVLLFVMVLKQVPQAAPNNQGTSGAPTTDAPC